MALANQPFKYKTAAESNIPGYLAKRMQMYRKLHASGPQRVIKVEPRKRT